MSNSVIDNILDNMLHAQVFLGKTISSFNPAAIHNNVLLNIFATKFFKDDCKVQPGFPAKNI